MKTLLSPHKAFPKAGLSAALFFLVFGIMSPAQEVVKYRVSGTIKEEGSNIPLAFSKIYVTTPENEKVTRTITLQDGIFNLSVPTGQYKIQIENTGHKTLEKDLIVKEEDLAFGDVFLAVGEDIMASESIANRLLVRKGTRVQYDVSRDPDAWKTSMMEMMSRIPDLKMSARNGNLEYDGKPVSSILINNERDGIINVKRQYPMEFIKAGYMRRIEVVLPGDSEYQNDAPILLIRLSKPLPYGFAAQISEESSTSNIHSPSVDMVANTPIIGIGAGYSYSFSHEKELKNLSLRQMTDEDSEISEVESIKRSREKSSSHNISLNLFRSFNKELIRFNATMHSSLMDGNSYSSSSTTATYLNGASETTDKTESKSTTHSPFRFNASMSLSGLFGPGDNRMKPYQWRILYGFINSSSWGSTSSDKFSQSTSTGKLEHRVNADIKLNNLISRAISLSMAAKGGYYYRNYNNRSLYDTFNSQMNYRQQVGFMKVDLLGNAFKNKLGFITSLNTEYLRTAGQYLKDADSVPLSYHELNFQPYVSISWALRRGSISASYNRTVKRPSINQLNPYTDNTNPYNVRCGNPELKGQNNDAYTLSYNVMTDNKWFQRFSVSTGYLSSSNTIAGIVTTDKDGVATYTYGNVGRIKGVTASTSISLSPVKRVTINVFATCTYRIISLPYGSTNRIISPSMTSNISWSPKWFEANASISIAPSLSSIQRKGLVMEPMGEFSISRYFSKPHLGISMAVNDIFHGGGYRTSTLAYNNFSQKNYTERIGRAFIFRLWWRLGSFRNTPPVEIKAYDL